MYLLRKITEFVDVTTYVCHARILGAFTVDFVEVAIPAKLCEQFFTGQNQHWIADSPGAKRSPAAMYDLDERLDLIWIEGFAKCSETENGPREKVSHVTGFAEIVGREKVERFAFAQNEKRRSSVSESIRPRKDTEVRFDYLSLLAG
jgi:hypothetical protein